jgi:hypothetical protein
MKQLALLMELRTWDPCKPVVLTTNPWADSLSTPRWKSMRPGAFFRFSAHRAFKVRGFRGCSPFRPQIARRTNNINVAMTETGFPGRPKIGVSPIFPKASGRPGLTAIFQKSISPLSTSASLT